MSETSRPAAAPADLAVIQRDWHELTLRVAALETSLAAQCEAARHLRALVEQMIDHRQRSHGELILLLSNLVSKLPLTDAGVVVAKLVEHNNHVAEVCAALVKGKPGEALPQPALLRALDQCKRDLSAALKPAVAELVALDSALDRAMLEALVDQPDLAFSPPYVRAFRCFAKGQVPRERIVREFGEAALACFNDLTTDPKLNPRPKPEEIVLAFKPDYEAVLAANPELAAHRAALAALYQRVQTGKSPTAEGRAQRLALNKLMFIIELLHYYENQNTELPEPIFAQRLPGLLEQIGITGPTDPLDEKHVKLAEELLALIVNREHRLTVINNSGKTTPAGRCLRYILRLRQETNPLADPAIVNEVIPEFVKHLLPPPPQPPMSAAALAQLLRFLAPDFQKFVLRALMNSDRLRKGDAEALGRAVAKELGLPDLGEEPKPVVLAPEVERQLAWDKIKDLLAKRAEPAAIAAAIRDRLHAKYESDEIKQSWVTLTETDPMTFIRVFCQLPYRPDGKTDPIAKPVLEAYATRLVHEKYAATYTKVVNSLKGLFKARPDNPTLQNFLALARWADPTAAAKIAHDVGLAQ
ncbi:MAG: hypothetical protein ACK45B_10340 [Limisphaerales bacterium]